MAKNFLAPFLAILVTAISTSWFLDAVAKRRIDLSRHAGLRFIITLVVSLFAAGFVVSLFGR